MTTTRRKSKAVAEHDAESSEAQRPLSLTLPDDIDEETLANLLPDTNLTSMSAENVVALYRLVATQVVNLDISERERDEARAELERKDVELDQVLQDKESLSKELEVSVEVANEELNKIKQERDQLAEAKVGLQDQLMTLSTSQSSASTEFETLKRRVDDTEREKRELVGVISRFKEEATQRDEEIHTLRANLKEARQEHQALESQLRELRSNETATKFKIDSLDQQLQLSKVEAERANNELMEKTEEFAKYRRAKHAEIATLQASFDTLTQSSASSEASLKALQSVHTAQGHQLTQALSKVQDLTSQLAEQEARYSNEVSGLKRLVTMMEEREKQTKEIVENVEREWATVGEKAERREASLKDEAEKERKARLEAEKRLEQLEVVLDKMGRGELPIPGRSAPSTPFRGNGLADTTIDAMMGLSPTVAMASRVQRSGKTFTEVYADYVQLQEEYVKKCAEYDHMDRTLSSVLAQIEERAPILSQQRIEYERLKDEAAELVSQLSQAITERDTRKKLAEESAQKLTKSTNENRLLQRQLDDLGFQVQNLLREIARRDDPTIPSNEELETVPVEALTDAGTLITSHLVLFKNIDELQRQNIRLLKIVRDFGEKMEREEREYRETMEKEQAEAIREAHEAMQELAAQLELQKQNGDIVIKAYVKERDALKAMLARAEAGGGLNASASPGLAMTSSDVAKELAEVQSQFDAYKLEMGIDSGRLRDDVITSQKEVNSMSAALAKANAKVEFLSDRQRMHEQQFRVHNLEIDELSKRNGQLNEQNVRLDVECGRLSDELQVALGRLEQLRNECANLRAEKKIWESIQGRLVEENRTLTMERSRLADLMGNVQKMHNDLERSGENDRRRLEGQLQMLENQTQDLRTQLLQERESVRQVSLQKDIELKELQTRIEKNTKEFSETRETLVAAQTSKKHLEEKIEDIVRQLKGNEEKLAVYERRPGSTGASQPAEDIGREQQLEAEVAELRSALKVKEVDLASAKSHKDQFQEISQASEAALVALNSTFDEYKASSEASITRYESEIKSMQERLEQGSKELADIRTQFNEQQKLFEAERTNWINDKKILEDTIVDLSTSEKQTENDRSSREQELKALEERAKTAEQRYSQEIIAHGESMKALEGLKKELVSAQASVREHRTASETAEVKLKSSENSWKQQKETLAKEVADLTARRQELSQQNATLHQHLESVSAQATRIRQAADAPLDRTEGESSTLDEGDYRLSELRSVVSYLRKEKGIVDLQLEMAKRENGVLKNQLERLSQTLEETRVTLAEERERAIQNSASAAQHAELVERINQLNILRESNATLRAEYESASKKSRDLETNLKQLLSELDPAKEQARSANAELEATKVQMQRLEQESRRWQERNSQLLSKYDRIDPAEVQALRDEIVQLKKDAAEAQEKLAETEVARAASTKRVEALEANLRAHKETLQKNVQFSKQRFGELNKQVSTVSEEKRQLEEKVVTLEQENSTLKAQPDSGSSKAAQAEDLQKQNDSLRTERDQLLAEKETWSKAAATSTDTVTSTPNWEGEKAELIKLRDEALEKRKVAEANSSKMSTELKNIKLQNDKFQTRIQDLMKTKAADAEKQAASIAEAVEKAKAAMNVTSDPQAADVIAKRHEDEMKALEEKLKAEYEVSLKAAVEGAVKDRPKESSNVDQQAAISAAVADVEKKAQARLQEEITAAVERGRMEQAAKNKLKDSQLVKAQKRVKELEHQIHEWQAAGITLPSPSTPSSALNANPTTPIATTSTVTVSSQPPTKAVAPGNQPASSETAAPSTTAAGSVKPVTSASTVSASSQPTLPRRPPMGPSAATRGGSAPHGPGRGGTALRGAGRGGVGRGAAPLRQPPVKPTAAANPASGGVSIIGAASKRPREESSTSPEDSLAKRLKPADSTT